MPVRMTIEKLVFGPTPHTITLYNSEGDIELHRAWTGPFNPRSKVLSTFHTAKHVRALRTAKDRLFVLEGEDTIDVIDLHHDRFHSTPWLVLDTNGRKIQCLACSPNGALVAAGLDDGHVHFWEITVPDKAEKAKRMIEKDIAPTLVAKSNFIERIAISNHHHIVSVSSRGDIMFWDPQTFTPVSTVPENGLHPDKGPAALVYQEKSQRVLMLDHVGKLWAIESMAPYNVRLLATDTQAIDLAASPDETRVCFVRDDNTVSEYLLSPFSLTQCIPLGPTRLDRVRYANNNELLVEDSNRCLSIVKLKG